MFDHFDADKNGQLSAEELATLLRQCFPTRAEDAAALAAEFTAVTLTPTLTLTLTVALALTLALTLTRPTPTALAVLTSTSSSSTTTRWY